MKLVHSWPEDDLIRLRHAWWKKEHNQIRNQKLICSVRCSVETVQTKQSIKIRQHGTYFKFRVLTPCWWNITQCSSVLTHDTALTWKNTNTVLLITSIGEHRRLSWNSEVWSDSGRHVRWTVNGRDKKTHHRNTRCYPDILEKTRA